MPQSQASGAMRVAMGVVLVVGVVLLMALAVGVRYPGLIVLLLAGVAVSLLAVRAAFPAVPLLWITFGIFAPLYTAIYATIITTLFRNAAPIAIHASYLMPLATFVAALFARRTDIAKRLDAIRPGVRPTLGGGLTWLALSLVMGTVACLLLPNDASSDAQTMTLPGAMAGISALVFLFVADIAALLTETGLLFRAFVSRMARRVVPIFSFVVVFFLVAVVFATMYALLDRFSGVANFSMAGDVRLLDFPRALYFSFVTLSTIGYGDITPVTNVARVIVVGEIVFGVVLMLFAFSEIAAYDPEGQERAKGEE